METMDNNNKGNRNTFIIIGVIVAVICACALIVGAFGVVMYKGFSDVVSTVDIFGTISPVDNSTATPEPIVTRPAVGDISTDTLNALQNTIVPENDPYQLACSLKNICNIPTTLPAPAVPYKTGDKQNFWIQNSNTNENFQIEATLMYITPHTYFWAQNPSSVNKGDMQKLMDTFENKIYPTDREFFGSEWTPGVDNDPHIYIIYAANIGSTVAGYFSSLDEYNPLARQYSNAHEAYVLGQSQDLADEYTYAVLAHEFVHMIQFPADRNDVSWINEGFAEVGAFLNGYSVGGADQAYAFDPDLQLNDWADPNSPDFGTHYGNSFLFLTYYLDRFGEKATKALTANPKNDLTSVDDTLQTLNITDPLTGKQITADDVFIDFAAAMFVQNPKVGDGRFAFHNYSAAPQTYATESISNCPSGVLSRNVHQYGIDYISVDCSGDHTLHFEGSTVTSLLPVDAYSGTHSFWSNKGDESDMTLTREFDFSNVSGAISLDFQTWYDLEKDYDYAYLEVSEDGVHWQIIKTTSGTDTNPTGASFGNAFNAKSDGWVQENVDLSAYAGKKIQVRFEYITDAAVNGEGLLLDDMHVDAIGYSTDFETDDGGWTAAGFVRVENVLPQTFRLALILDHNGQITVQYIEVSADQVADIPLSLQSGDTATLIVTGTTRFTRGLANYSVEIR